MVDGALGSRRSNKSLPSQTLTSSRASSQIWAISYSDLLKIGFRRTLDLNRSVVENAIRSFLAEDLGYGDITTNVLVDSERGGEGRVVCGQNAVIAGIEEALVLLELVSCHGTARAHDGDRIKAGTMILSARGPARALLGVERTLLNLLTHMSGVATATADLVSIAKRDGTAHARIACTRKTLP